MLKSVDTTQHNISLEHSVAAVAAAMSDPSRVKILCALMDGRAWTATELSVAADISSSTTSAHLNRLVNTQLLSCVSQGRHRYYRLADRDIAGLIENIMGVSWKRVPPAGTTTPSNLRLARTCYDHLAGEIAVNIYQFMTDHGWVSEDGSRVTQQGRKQFLQLGISLEPKTSRKPCCACLDWSERRFHLGGYAGAAFLHHCEQHKWLTRTPGYREVCITHRGKLAFQKHFHVFP